MHVLSKKKISKVEKIGTLLALSESQLKQSCDDKGLPVWKISRKREWTNMFNTGPSWAASGVESVTNSLT